MTDLRSLALAAASQAASGTAAMLAYVGYPDSLVGTSIVHYSPVTDFVVGKDD
jgi:hypothetical protein